MKPPFIVEWLAVTPALAAEWLTKNTKNRNLRETTVLAFARDMDRGAWSENHQAIAFGKHGLIDGQHRLAAVVKSDKTINFLVIKDVPERFEGVKAAVMDTVDRGNQRSVADILKLQHGYTAESSNVVSTCNMIATIGIQDSLDRVKRVGVSTVLAIADRYRTGLTFVLKNRAKTLGLRSAPVCAAIAFGYMTSPKKTEDFCKRFTTGVGLDDESPILVLRNYLLNEGGLPRSGMRVRLDLAELVLHTLFCFVNRKPMPRPPKPGQRSGADWFRRQQAENVQFLESLFPSLTNIPQGVVTAKNFKLTPAAEDLLGIKQLLRNR